ncbi:zf-HC2 domain-containing protein [bacterium]|nr:zf-HC2 domain-containing protein [bacterium]
MKNANEEAFTCRMFKKHLRAYIDEELADTVKIRFLEHASQCQKCNKAMKEMGSIVKVLSRLSPVTTSPEFNFTLRSRIRLENARLQNPFYRFSLFIRENIRTFITVPVFSMIVVAALFFYSDARNTFDSGTRISNMNSPSGAEMVKEAENSADEIVYVYYVLETVHPTDIEGGIFLQNMQAVRSQKQTIRSASLINF